MKTESTATQRLWVVTEVYYPEQISTGYYLTSIAEGLALDLNVKVLCGQPNYGSRGLTAPKHEHRNNVEIFRASSTRLDKNVIPFRVINMITLGISMFLKSLNLFKPGDSVLVVTAPPSLPFTTALAALIKGSSYTLLLHDSYPEILVAVGKARAGSLFVRIVNLFNRWLYKNAAKIIVVGRDMHDLLTAKTAGLAIPIVTIPNWADLELIEPQKREENTLLAELGIQSKFVFMYAGNIGHPTDIETIIDAAAKLQDDDRFHFVFIGAGAKKQWLVNAVDRRELNNITILDQRPRADQSVFLNACDIGIISLVPGMLGTAMPSRTYNILAAGKPILALTDEGSELAQVIDEERVGWHIRPREPAALVNTIAEIAGRDDELAGMGERARAAAEAKYSLADAVSGIPARAWKLGFYRMKVLLTGATGFIGNAIQAELRGKGFEIIPVGGPRSSESDILSCDISDRDAVMKLSSVGKVDAVVHAAGLAHRFRGGTPEAFIRTNVDGASYGAELAVQLQAKHFILLSSVLVYGRAAEKAKEPVDEETPCIPIDVYGQSKLDGEMAAREVCGGNSTSLSILRLVPTIGEGSKGNFAKLVGAIDRGQFIWVGKGENHKSMIYVGDIARAVGAVLKAGDTRAGTFNLAASPITMNELVGEIARTLGKKVPAARVPALPLSMSLRILAKIPFAGSIGGLSDTMAKWLSDEVYSAKKIQSEIGFTPKTSLISAARHDVTYYMKNVGSNRRK